MTIPVANVDVTTDTFGGWIAKTNQLAAIISANTVTVDTTSTGSVSTGNGFVNGVFGSNTLVASTIRGGSINTANTLTISSNVNITGTLVVNGTFAYSAIDVATSLVPSTNNVYNLGSVTNTFNTAFVTNINSNTANIATANITSINATTLTASNSTFITINATTANVASSARIANAVINSTSISAYGLVINSSGFSGTANNALNLGGVSLSTINNNITANAATAYSTAYQDSINYVAAAGYQTTAGLAANVATLTSNNTVFINGNNVVSVMESLRANMALTGGGVISVDSSYNVRWTTRFIVIANGRGSHFSTTGYYDIECPTSGTIIGVGGAPDRAATASGIYMSAWEVLYYILPIGSNNTSSVNNFRVVGSNLDIEIPSNWILVCRQNAEETAWYFNNGVKLRADQSYNSTLQSSIGIGTNTFTVGTSTSFAANGNVGIGTATPGVKLQVEGAITSSGIITTSSAEISAGSGQAEEKRVRLSNSTRNVYFVLGATGGAVNLYDASGAITRWSTDTSGNFTAAGNVTAYSDVKLKVNIRPLESALKTVSKLRGVRYQKISDGTEHIGVIAQEVQQILPEVVHTGDDGTLSVAYGNMVALLIEAVKELSLEIETLKSSR